MMKTVIALKVYQLLHSFNHSYIYLFLLPYVLIDTQLCITDTGTFCPSSVTGSPRHMKKKAINGLHVVSELGGPTEFTTLTVNTAWREIVEKLLVNQSAFDRPDIVNMVSISHYPALNYYTFTNSFLIDTQVFKAKLDLFIENLKNGVYHNSKVVNGVYVPDESQPRGKGNNVYT